MMIFLRLLHTQFSYLFFFFNDTATTEIYTLSLHDALPISHVGEAFGNWRQAVAPGVQGDLADVGAKGHQLLPAGGQQEGRRLVGRRDHPRRSEEHTSELQSPCNLVCRLLLEKKQHTLTSHRR